MINQGRFSLDMRLQFTSMSAVAVHGQERELSARDRTRQCHVPEDPYIKLAYYLESVHTTSIPEDIPYQFLSWDSMYVNNDRSTDKLRDMLSWSEAYSPSKMRQAGYFIMVPPNTMSLWNKMVEITASARNIDLFATNEAVMRLLRRTSASVNVMFYEKIWEDYYYYWPRQQLLQMIEDRNSICSVY
jgi:hypothetical protein